MRVICILKKIEDLWNPCKTLTKNGKYFVKKNSKQNYKNSLISQIFSLNVLLIESEKRKGYSYNSMKR